MSTTELSPEQLRALVDAVPATTMDEVVERAAFAHLHEPRRRRPLVVAVAGMMAVAAVVAGLLALRSDNGTERVSVPATSLPRLPENCVVTKENTKGCPFPKRAAAAYLGFDVRTPRIVPKSWRRFIHHLRVYPDANTLTDPPSTVYVYQQSWSPRGTDLDALGTCPVELTVRERLAYPREELPVGPQFDLGDGRTANGSVDDGTCGTGGPIMTFGHLTWVEDGVSYTVNTTGLDEETVRRIIDSLHA